MTEEKLEELLQDMSLKEKIGQMMQLDVSCFKKEGPVTGSEVEQGITGEDLTLAGSILGAVGAEEIKDLQKRCMEKQPHHIPQSSAAYIINGYKTIFPIPLALGCTFSQGRRQDGRGCYGQGVCCGRTSCDLCANGRSGKRRQVWEESWNLQEKIPI